MELRDTIMLMASADYKKRFKAEYYQNKIRYDKLKAMLEDWDSDQLNFVPTCPRSIYDLQISFMKSYLSILEARAKIEKIAL